MLAQMGEMPAVLSPKLLETIHAGRVATPNERARMRKFLERLADPHYGLGWRSYAYAGNRIVGHRGGVNGYRSLILFDPARKSGVVALWNSNTSQPGGLEFEVMDMLYRLPFRDWMELDQGAAAAAPAARADRGNRGEFGRPPLVGFALARRPFGIRRGAREVAIEVGRAVAPPHFPALAQRALGGIDRGLRLSADRAVPARARLAHRAARPHQRRGPARRGARRDSAGSLIRHRRPRIMK